MACDACSNRFDWQHFALSVLILVGGGVMVMVDRQLMGPILGAQGLVIGHWFGSRKNGNGNGKK